ncbi:MAG: hypothetical protein EHM58_09345 [Ignavibacteriae bacterium]|nr:MAG: hypothetical protein EHM58_09345 [Ignavibacteriota bacterium]
MELTLEKQINCPVSSVYKAFTDAAVLSQWFTSNAKVDLRVGGRYSNDDNDEGKYLEIQPNKLVKFTWDNKNYCPGTEVSVFFNGGDKTTDVTLIHHNLATEKHVNSMKSGWTWALANVKLYLEEGKKIGYEEWLKTISNEQLAMNN